MHIAYYPSLHDTSAQPFELPWEELVEWLATSTALADKMLGDGWSPVLVSRGARRSLASVQAVTCAVLDLDKLPSMALIEAACAALAGLAFVAHSTHSHRPDKASVRVVVQLSRPLHPQEWPALWARLVAETGIPADPTGRDPSRFYFAPSHPPGAEPWHRIGEGTPLDVDELLKLPGPPLAAIVPARPDARLQAASGPVDMDALRAALRGADNALVQATLAGKPLPASGHDDALNRIAGAFAFLLPLSTPWEGYLELIRPTLEATPCEKGVEHHVAEFRDMIDRARGRKADAVLEAERSVAALKGAFAPPAPTGAEDDAWEEDLVWIEVPTKTPDMPPEQRLRQCAANVELILRKSPEWRGALRWDEVKKEIELVGGPLQFDPSVQTLDVEVTNWFARSRWHLYSKHFEVGAQIVAVARRNPYDPLRAYLLGLKHDGVPRVDTFLRRYAGAEDSAHVADISRKWFIAAVARALSPGCKVDNVLILEGAQGAKKSTLFAVLAGEWFSDTPIDPGDKDSRIAAASRWIIEMAELTVFGRSDENRLKNFFSAKVDFLRPPFGKAPEPFKRRCVFVGTTNRDDYLHDETGNRRYWSVRIVGEIDIAAVKRDRDQLWAEAVAIYQAAESCPGCRADSSGRCNVHAWWLRGSSESAAETAASERVPSSQYAEVIAAWWASIAPDKRPRELKLFEVAERALNLERAHAVETRVVRSVASALRQLGFRRVRLAAGVHWEPTDALLQAPQTEGGRVRMIR